jgi:hypothetical protein
MAGLYFLSEYLLYYPATDLCDDRKERRIWRYSTVAKTEKVLNDRIFPSNAAVSHFKLVIDGYGCDLKSSYFENMLAKQ